MMSLVHRMPIFLAAPEEICHLLALGQPEEIAAWFECSSALSGIALPLAPTWAVQPALAHWFGI